MSTQAARDFFTRLNATASLQEEVLSCTARFDLEAIATAHGFDCNAEDLRAVAAEELAGQTVRWLGRRVTWRPDVCEEGMLVVDPGGEGDDVRLTEHELDLVSAGIGGTCNVPNCSEGCGSG